MPHIHVGAAEFAVFLLQLIIALFLIRVAEMKLAGTSFGKALAFIH